MFFLPSVLGAVRTLDRLPSWLSGNEPTCQCRRCGFDPWIRKIPLEEEMATTPVFLPKKSHGQRSLVGYSPWGCKEREREVAQWCPTLCDPMDCSPPGSSVHGISQARILEWAAIPFSRQNYVISAKHFLPAWLSRAKSRMLDL